MKQLILVFQLILVVAISLMVLCNSYGNNNNELELGIKKTSIGYQSDVIIAFIDNDIPFYMDSEGILKYPGKYQEKVDNILNKLDKRPEVQFSDYKFASLFIISLKKNNVNFLIREGSNKSTIHIVFQEKDKKIVDKYIYPEFKKLLLEGRKTGVYGAQQYPPR